MRSTLQEARNAVLFDQRQKPFVLVFIQGVRVERKKRAVVEPPNDDEKADHGFRPQEDYGFGTYPQEPYVITDKPITLSVSAYAPHTFSFQPDVPIANLQVAVICDVTRVRVDQIVVATQNLSPTVEAGPLSYADGIVAPYNRIVIVTSLR